MLRKVIPLFLIWPLVATSFAAEPRGGAEPAETIVREMAARPGGRVHILQLAGHLEIHGWDRDVVEVSGTLGRGAEIFHMRTDGQRIWIEVELAAELGRGDSQSDGSGVGEANLHVSLPRGSSLEVRAASALVEMHDLIGPLDVETTSGGVSLDNGPGVDADRVSITTTSGAVSVSAISRILRIRSVEGNLHVDRLSQDLEVETATGDILIEAEVLRESRIESGSGTIRYRGGVADIGHLQIFSHQGTVDLRLPADTEALFDLESRFGVILGAPSSPGDAQEPRGSWRLKTGHTEAQIFVRSFRGDIRLSRQDS